GPVLGKDHPGLRAGADQFRKVGIDFSVAFQLVTDARGLCPYAAVAVDEMNGAPLGHVPLAGPCSLAGPAAPGSVSDEYRGAPKLSNKGKGVCEVGAKW